ncbi:MAG: glycoside hydrolase family 99-like domain-containing protein [Cyclobacteriaceae bacterium]
MEKIKNILIVVSTLLISACVDDEVPTPDDHFLNYDIPDVPVDQDYIVGAYYNSFAWDPDMVEVPSAGLYDAQNGDPAAYQSHIANANTGGIDYFIFGIRSAVNPAQFTADSSFVAMLQSATNASDMNFALNYNFGAMQLSDNNRIEGKGFVDDLVADFERMEDLFKLSNYMQVEGKKVVMISNAANLHSDDNVSLITQVRSAMSAKGIDLYIIGTQPNWTPPLRYEFRYIDAVDAVSHDSYIRIQQAWYDRYLLFHNMVDQALTYSQEALGKHNLEYIPQISPSYNGKILAANNNDVVVEKNADWFNKYCDIAKRSSSANRMIIVDSFNNWNQDKQVEPAQSYSDNFLKILKDEFKVN